MTDRRPHGTDLAALVHRGEHAARARRLLRDLVRDSPADGAAAGDIRAVGAPDDLADRALEAAGSLPSEAAVRRLVTVALAGLRPPR